MASQTRTEAACLASAMESDRIAALFLGNKPKPKPAFQQVQDGPTPEWSPNYSLDRFIASARAEMGEARWNELNREWNA